MPEIVPGNSLGRETELKSFRRGNPAEERCGIKLYDEWTNRSVEVLEYSRDMPNGGTRKLVVKEDGMLLLTGRDPVLDILDQEKDGVFEYSTSYDAVEYELEHFPNLGAYHGQNYDDLDELIEALEIESGLSFSLE